MRAKKGRNHPKSKAHCACRGLSCPAAKHKRHMPQSLPFHGDRLGWSWAKVCWYSFHSTCHLNLLTTLPIAFLALDAISRIVYSLCVLMVVFSSHLDSRLQEGQMCVWLFQTLRPQCLAQCVAKSEHTCHTLRLNKSANEAIMPSLSCKVLSYKMGNTLTTS